MEFLKAQFARIQAQLAGLSASQKMLSVSLVAIMIMTMMWWSHWAAVPEMEPILNQSLSTEEIGQITSILDSKDIPHSVIGDKVMVPADRKMEVLAELGFSQALPHNFDSAFDDMIKQSTWIDSPDKSDRMFLEAKQRTLATVISNFPGVASAVVMIDPTSERRFDDTAIQPSASIMIATRGGQAAPRQLAESAADVVSGAQAGLLRSRINLVIDGAPFNVKDRGGDDMGGDGMVDLRRQSESYYRDKVREQFAFIHGIMVSVTCKLNTASSVSTKHTVDPKTTVQIPTQNEEQTTESNAQTASSGGEPGAVPNVGADVGAGSGGGGTNTNTSDSKTTYKADNSQEDVIVKQGPGDATVMYATVRVPRSYFVNACKSANGGKDTDDATLAAFTDSEIKQIRKDVQKCAGVAADDDVSVSAYSDEMPQTIAGAPTAAQPTTAAAMTLVTGHIKEVGIGVLAIISLFMVSMMVRKSGAPVPVAVAASAARDDNETQTLEAGDAIIGQVGEGNSTLDAVELDDEAVKAQQVVQQVQNLVESNPDAAANLVKRWLNRV